MRYSVEHKQETRRKLLDAAGRRFRAQGFDGLGIDGLTKEAGVTNGAFYSNFTSKAEAFRTIVEQGMEELAAGIQQSQDAHGESWPGAFAEFYFGDVKLNCPEDTCPLPAFAPEVARAPEDTKQVFQAELEKVAQIVSQRLPEKGGDTDRAQAWTLLAMLAGGVLMARAVQDADLASDITASIREAISSGRF